MPTITEALFHVAPGIVEAAEPSVVSALTKLAKRSPDDQVKIAKMMDALSSVVTFPDDAQLEEFLNR